MKWTPNTGSSENVKADVELEWNLNLNEWIWKWLQKPWTQCGFEATRTGPALSAWFQNILLWFCGMRMHPITLFHPDLSFNATGLDVRGTEVWMPVCRWQSHAHPCWCDHTCYDINKTLSIKHSLSVGVCGPSWRFCGTQPSLVERGSHTVAALLALPWSS